MELESDGCLPFLDICIKRNGNNLEFSVYRKPTNTDHVIHATSAHPIQYKMSTFSSFICLLLSVPMSHADYNRELSIVNHIAKENGYPLKIINKLLTKTEHNICRSQFTSLNVIRKETGPYFSIPYIPQLAENIRNYFKKFKINVVFAAPRNLKSLLFNPTRSFNSLTNSGVYKLSCTCGGFYIGRTFRSIQQRVNEHLGYVKTSDSFKKTKSAFAFHIYSENHNIDTNNPSVAILHTGNVNSEASICNLEVLEILNEKHKNPDQLLNDFTEFENTIILKRAVDAHLFISP